MCVGVAILVLVLVGRICRLVGSPYEVAQGPLLELLLGKPPSEVLWGPSAVVSLQSLVVSLVSGWSC